MMHCGKDPAETFKTMAEVSETFNTTSSSEDTENTSIVSSGDNETKRRLSFSSEKDSSSLKEPNMTLKELTFQDVHVEANISSAEIGLTLSPAALTTLLNNANNDTESKALPRECRLNTKHERIHKTENKENIATPSATSTAVNTQEEDMPGQRGSENSEVSASKQHGDTEQKDAEVVRRAQEQGFVNVVFPGTVSQDGCCRFVSEILKCILYQRQQLPMTYDQLVYSQKKQASMQDNDTVCRRPVRSADMDWRKCQQTLQDLEEVLQQLEVLFSLSRVPRVLLLMGGSLILPKELYEINMEALVLVGGEQCLRVSSCLRQLFRTLFVADLLSDTKPVRLMATTVLVLAHRDCGMGWFFPKLQFKVPSRVKNQVICLSTDPSTCKVSQAEGSDWEDYVWFQAPMTIKGFSN